MNKLEILLHKCEYDKDYNLFKKSEQKVIFIEGKAIVSEGKNSELLIGKLKDLSGFNDNLPIILKKRPPSLSVKNWIFECYITQMIENLNDDHFSKLMGIFTDNKNELCIVLKFYKNNSLKNYYLNNVVPFDIKIKHIIKILETLFLLNENNISHCDLKNDNVLIDDDINIKLTDFGSASLILGHIDAKINNSIKNNRIIKRYDDNKYSLRIPIYLYDINIKKLDIYNDLIKFDIWCLGILTLFILFRISNQEFYDHFLDRSNDIYVVKTAKLDDLFRDFNNINNTNTKSLLREFVDNCFKERSLRPSSKELIKLLSPIHKLI